MRANNDNRPETLLAIVDAATAERVVRLASPVIQEERPFQLFDLLMRGISVLLSELQFVSLLYFQQLPYVSHPFFQLGNVGIVEMPGAVDAAADVVDVCGNPADSGS